MNRVERFLEQIAPHEGGCWLWTGTTAPNGYGRFTAGPIKHAHRFAYQLWNGPIPAGHHVDHLCDVRACVNPDHLEAVTPSENSRRIADRGRNPQALKTHCASGHEFTPENTYVRKDKPRPQRQCKTCTAIRLRRLRAEQKRAA